MNIPDRSIACKVELILRTFAIAIVPSSPSLQPNTPFIREYIEGKFTQTDSWD